SAVGGSNGRRGEIGARIEGVSARAPSWAGRIEGNLSRAASLSAPDYVLGNTGSAEWNLGAAVRRTSDRGTFDLTWHRYDFTGGVCWCQGAETAADFVARLDDPIPVGAEAWTPSYGIERANQEVSHDSVVARARLGARAPLTVTWAFQDDHRREYDRVRESITGPQYDFLLLSHAVEVAREHAEVELPHGALTGSMGAQGLLQDNVYRGLPLVPNFRAYGFGAFALERYTTPRAALELGARYDHLSRVAYLTEDAYDRNASRGTLGPDDCEVTDVSARCPAHYDTASVSMGGVWRAGPALEARIDLSTASRFPTADELYLNGSAPTSPVYALGDPSLGVETTAGASPTVAVALGPWTAEGSAWANVIDDFVYFAPTLDPSGRPQIDVTIRGAYPEWSFRPIDALFYGVDGGTELGADAVLGLALSGSIVRGTDRTTGGGLVMVPADRLRAVATARPHLRGVDAPYVSAELTAVARAANPGIDLAPPPDGYVLLGASAGARFEGRRAAVRVGVQVTNLLDAAYRDYTSLLRYSADEPGRDVVVRVAIEPNNWRSR
ncbi:MAG: TonB-dependent receptor, partial [Myxococcota bacterium]